MVTFHGFHILSEIHKTLSTPYCLIVRTKQTAAILLFAVRVISLQTSQISHCVLLSFLIFETELLNRSTKLLLVFAKDWDISKMTVSSQMIYNDLQFCLKCLISVTLDKGLLVESEFLTVHLLSEGRIKAQIMLSSLAG